MRIAIAYGIWSGVGIILISIIGIVLFGQRLDIFAIVGLALILAESSSCTFQNPYLSSVELSM